MKRLNGILVACVLMVTGTASADDYNRVSISCDVDHYGYNKEFYGNNKDENPSFTACGFGLSYVHGFSLSKKLPMFLEVGGNISYCDNTELQIVEVPYNDEYVLKTQFGNLNVRIPVNFAWKFQLNQKHSLTPYTGINFKFNCLTQFREGIATDGRTAWTDWISVLKKNESKDVHEEDVWNIFQMGWQIGLNWGIKRVNLGLEWGYDFLPAYYKTIRIGSFKETFKVNTCSFKFSVGYTF